MAVGMWAVVSGCAMSPAKREGMLIGAAGGALFSGAAACGAAAAAGSQNSNAVAIACPIGILGGAIVGGTFGYLLTQSPESVERAIPPPPLTPEEPVSPPPLTAQQSAVPPPPLPPPPTSTPTPTPPSTSTPTPPPPTATPASTLVPLTASPTPLPPPPPSAAPPPQPPPETTTEQLIVLRGVHFGQQRSDLSDSEKAILDQAAATLKAHPGARIYVKGYTDAAGSAEGNQKLSQERAATVAAYLESRGVALDQLIVMGMGASHFVAKNDTEQGRARNRRVELEPVMGEP